MTTETKNNNLEIAKKYFEIAEKDLEASKLLYDKGLYSMAIYHLQQCAEKLVKSYLLEIGMDIKGFEKYFYSHTPINPHVLKAIDMYFFGYKYQNMIIASIAGAYFYFLLYPLIRKDQNFDNKFFSYHDVMGELVSIQNVKDSISILNNEDFNKLEGVPKEILSLWHEIGHNKMYESLKNINDDIYKLSDEDFNKLKEWSKEILSLYKDVEHKMYESLRNLNVDDTETILKKEKKEIYNNLSIFASSVSLPKLMDNQKYVVMLNLCDSLITNERIKAYVDECFFEVFGKKRDEYFNDCYKELKKGKKIKTNSEKVKDKNNIRIIFENMIKDISIKFANRDNSIREIMWLSMILGPHEAYTRYPKIKEEDILEESDYKPGLGIVDAHSGIYNALKKCIDKYKVKINL